MPPRPLAPLAGFRRSARASVVLVLLALATVHPASATTLRMLGLDDLAQGATDIVVARVESVQPRWTRDHRSIVTEVRVKVEERLKGDEAPTLTIVTPGGELDGIRVEVDAVPAFVVGERCVLFASRATGTAHARLYGLEQGKFELLVDPSGREVVARGSMTVTSKELVKPGSPSLRTGVSGLKLDRIEFTRLVRSQLGVVR